MKKWIFVFAVLFWAIPCQAEQIIYVDADAPGPDYDGSSWTNAYNYFQDGLTDANSAVKPVEIRVAAGIYTPDTNLAMPGGSGDREASFQLINGVTLKGSYAGFGEPDPNARDIKLYETILSGDLNGNDIDVNDPDDLWDEPSRDDNSYHVVGGSDTNTTAVLDGFTITGGNAHGSYPDYCGGGGMYNSSGSPRVTNCTFICNASKGWGGGMFNYHSSPTLANCTFSTNGGGGMDNDFSDPRLTNCTFCNNNWSAIYCNLGSLTLTNCTFTGNLGVRFGGAIFNQHSSCTLTNCILWGNIPDEIYETQGVTVITYSNVQGSWPGEGNIDVDPCFADPNNGDYHLKSQAGRWDPNTESWVTDANTSPCIDAGNPGCPLGDEPNDANNVRINMGTYGGTAEASKSPADWRNIADLTNDWAVDFSDLKVFVDYWLDTGECIPSDLDRSQSVDFSDFAIFANNWLRK